MTNYRRQRDMSEVQFMKALAANGLVRTGFLGYYELGNGISVSIHNAGINLSRRAKLAYLLNQKSTWEAKLAKEREG